MKRNNLQFVLTVCISIPMAFVVFSAIDMNRETLKVESETVGIVASTSNTQRDVIVPLNKHTTTTVVPTPHETKQDNTSWHDEWSPAALRKSSQKKMVFPAFNVVLKSSCNVSRNRMIQNHSTDVPCARRPMWDNTDAPLRPSNNVFSHSDAHHYDYSKYKHPLPNELFDCRPCRNAAEGSDHSVIARTRRRYRFQEGYFISRKPNAFINRVRVACNPEDVFFGTQSHHFDSTSNQYNFTNPIHSMSLIKHVSFINDTRNNMYSLFVDQEVILWTSNAYLVRAFFRTVWVLYGAQVSDCSEGPALCHLICPATYFPYTPCENIQHGTTQQDVKKFPKYSESGVFTSRLVSVDHRVKQSPFKLAVCMTGLTRSLLKTAPSVKANVLSLHRVSHVFVATWNVQGSVTKGRFRSGKHGDAVVSVEDMYDLLSLSYGKYLRDVDVLNATYWFPQFQDSIEDQNLRLAPFYFLIQRGVRMMRRYMATKNISYDVVMIVRPDVEWFAPVQFYLHRDRNTILSYVHDKNQTHYRIFTESIAKGEVGVHKVDSLFWGTTWSAGDWVHVGHPETMFAWDKLYDYGIENYAGVSGGILQAAFMMEYKQRWVVHDFHVALLRLKCVTERHMRSFGHVGVKDPRR
eukprot:PhF_6_TR30168/c0_g2_i1/m.44246